MADSGSEEETVPTISIILKASSGNITLEVPENITILKLKEQLSLKSNQPVDKICLIFSGKILKDHDTLKTYNITDGMAVHMVFRSVQQPASAPQRVSPVTTPSTGTAPRSEAHAPNIPGVGGMNLDTARRMMNSPVVQQMLNNPEFLRNMISGNEQIQNIARQNPEIGHLLNDPEIIRQTIDMIRNPSMFQEMMRNHDQAIRNLQGIPGGEAALQRLYQDVQEPLLNSATSGGNPFASGSNTGANTESRSQRAGVENADPLPNPWGGRAPPTATSTATAPAASADPLTAVGSESGTGTANIGDLLADPAMQDTMQQMLSNPDFMRNMMSPQMLRQAQQMFGGTAIPSSDEDINRLSEQVSNLMSNPEMMQGMMNPRVIQALNNIRTSLEVIRTEAPGMFTNLFQNLSTTVGSLDGTGSTAATGNGGANDTATAELNHVFGGQNPQQILEMLNQFANSAGRGVSDNRPPEERFRDQLEQLIGMGFTNQEANIRALQDAQGDVNAAVDRLLHQR